MRHSSAPIQLLRDIHGELLQAVAAARAQLGETKLTTFFPMRGVAAKDELMIVGRAVRGWQGEEQCWTAAEAMDEGRRKSIIDNVFQRSVPDSGCPMNWLNEARSLPRGDRDYYNWRRSAFWRVIYGVSEALLGCNLTEWPSRLIWSDLYKVAPEEKPGNPWPLLMDVQRELCQHHLAEELGLWKPDRVLFLTGWAWANPFLTHLRAAGERRSKFVEWSGTVELSSGKSARVVVAVHPQCKPGTPIVNQILQHFR